ncbi:MAG: hypothetical protein ACLFQE_01975, partial [Thermotogota bacterium]
MSQSKYDSQVSVTLRGDVSYTNVSQIFSSGLFKWLIENFIKRLQKRKAPILAVLEPFKNENGYNIKRIINVMYMLNLNKIDYLYDEKIIEVTEEQRKEYSDILQEFVESFYNYWR